MNRYEQHMHRKNTGDFFVSKEDRRQRNAVSTCDAFPKVFNLAREKRRAIPREEWGDGRVTKLGLYVDRAFRLWGDWYRQGPGSYWRGTQKPTPYTLQGGAR